MSKASCECYKLLHKDLIINEISIINKEASNKLKIKIFDSIQSTNLSLKSDISSKNIILSDDIVVYTAEHQSHGKGRGSDKKWDSPYAENLYVSCAWLVTECYLKSITSLSIKLSQLIIDLLKEYNINDIKLKWPNDVYVNNKKISGVLIEVVKISDSEYAIICGIGLNINMKEDIFLGNTSIKEAINQKEFLDRNIVLSNLLNKIYDMIKAIDYSIDFKKLKEYNILNYNKAINKPIKLIMDSKEYMAEYLDITSNGALEVLIGGEIRKIYSVDKLIL